jgi:hypothetical protein
LIEVTDYITGSDSDALPPWRHAAGAQTRIEGIDGLLPEPISSTSEFPNSLFWYLFSALLRTGVGLVSAQAVPGQGCGDEEVGVCRGA